MKYYSIRNSGSMKDFVMNQIGPREELKAIRLYLKKPADHNPPPFVLNYGVADDVTEQHIDNATAIPAIQTVGFSESFVENYSDESHDIFQFVPCKLWLKDKSRNWSFYVIRFKCHSNFYDREATNQHQIDNGGYAYVYKASGLNFKYAAHDSKRSHFTFTENFYKLIRKEKSGIVMSERNIIKV